MNPDIAMNLPDWFGVLLVIGLILAFGLLSVPYDDSPKTKITIRQSPWWDQAQKRHKEMGEHAIAPLSQKWQERARASWGTDDGGA